MPTTASAEAPRPGHDWHGLPPGRRAATAARARLHAIERRRRHSRGLDAHLARTEPPPTPAAAIPSEAERRELANALARAGFDPAYLAHRYGLTPRTARADRHPDADTRPGHPGGHSGGHQPGQHRGGQRQLSAPDTRTPDPARGRTSGQNSHQSDRQEGTR
ncbi:hypothetical protein GCM10028784_36950 [Myceligenerans cantabricum]